MSAREREIIEAVCQGLGNRAIARKLAISLNTVKAHLARIFTKLHVTHRAQLIIQASQDSGR